MKLRLFTLVLLLIGILPVAAQDDATACDDGFRLIVHELGETCVPEDVQRVVTLEHSMTESVVTLGVQPVGVADIELYNTLVNLSIPLSEDAVNVGTRQEPNLEVITSLNPDLIIAASWRVSETYDALNAIAPTIAFVGSDDLATLADYFTTIATVLNREEEAAIILEDMNQHFANATELVANADIDPGFVLSQTWYIDDIATFRLFTDNAIPVEILTQIGLENTWDAEITPDGFSLVGIETLGEIEDTNFFYITDPASAPFYAESPLWNALPFVQAGNAYRLDDSLWLFGGPLSAQRFVDAVLESLGIAEATTSDAEEVVLPVVEAGFPELDPAQVTNFEIIDETDETLTVRHLYGETTFPREPQRIVTDMNTAEILISLGIIPVGYMSPEGQGISPIIAQYAPDMVLLPVIEGPNYEQILTLEPDLIIAASWVGTDGEENQYELMNAIAPTLPFTIWPGLVWKDATRQVATLFDQEEQAEAIIADYDQRLADARQQLDTVFGDETVSQLLFFGPSAWLYSPFEEYEGHTYAEDSIGWLYYELGLAPGPGVVNLLGGQTDEFIQWVEITGEQLPEILADNIIVFPNGYSGAEGISEGYTEYIDSPIWQALPAVQSGNVYIITGVNKARGYYTQLDNIEIFVDIVTGNAEQ